VAVAVACSLVVVLSSGLAAAGRKQQANPVCEIVSAPVLRPRLLFTTPPVALTSILEVLRRPQSRMEMLPPGGLPRFGYSVLWFNYVRFLGSGAEQTRYYLIPGITNLQLPADCLRSLPPNTRREYETEAQARRAGSVTLEAFAGEAEAAAIPYTAQAIQAGDTLLAIPNQSDSPVTIAGVMPDGVASVTITAANGSTETARVTNNLFLASPPQGGLSSLTVRWYAPDGSLVKTIQRSHVHLAAAPETGGPVQFTLAPPPAVVRAGERQVAEFERGRTVMAQSGCLACHRIAGDGNAGPGPDLTHVASRLPRQAIARTLVNPTAPMPSFRNLPAAKFRALVTFLSDLR